ncbi:Holliday junction branch migration protein RuvA [Oecophyllibacter saccharovorans]|uniref:Holliday junction branch migration complex subunit RuvA n=1 Tax=Oecophyllibacter saccharovorans TaxID=2558360 RepID=A0A506UM06_9PROT|nr:Holliday junction branch migration protein RuvA [Oecophyllibacter saccharovorans]TPW34359.1 Holliday junction branch migration protein RuvA [Oecophyllibacter saccharovorans]
MIGQLTGLVSQVEQDRCLVDVNGVGYVVSASTHTLAALARPPEVARVLIETVVREDAIQLFGFFTPEERNWFCLLTTVQGVGARVALAILSVSQPQALLQAVNAGDKQAFTQAAGVGPKLALRIITELRSKVAKMPGLAGAGSTGPLAPLAEGGEVAGLQADVLMALEGLGFRRAETWPVVSRLMADTPDATLDQILRQALQELAR